MYSADLAFIHHTAFSAASRPMAREIVRLLRRRGIESGLVVEIGCGSGRMARELLRGGYDLVGFDVSPAMIRLARQTAPEGTFRAVSVAKARIPRCRAVLACGEVVTYVPGGLPELRRFFERAYAALRPGGVLVFDFLHTAKGRTYHTKTFGGDGWTMAVRADYSARASTLTRRIVVLRRAGTRWRRSMETHRVRVYDPKTIARVLQRIGFSVELSRSIGRHAAMKGDTIAVAVKPRI